MVDREFDLGRADAQAGPGFDVPHQRKRRRDTPSEQRGLTDEQLRTFFPNKNYEFNHIPLAVTGAGIDEVGFLSRGERIEAYELDEHGKKTLRRVLTGYQGMFGSIVKEKIRIELVGTIDGENISAEFSTFFPPSFNLERYARAIMRKNVPISGVTDRETEEIGLASKTLAGLLGDIDRINTTVGSGIFSRGSRQTLRRARAVAQHIRSNFSVDIPHDQPKSARVK